MRASCSPSRTTSMRTMCWAWSSTASAPSAAKTGSTTCARVIFCCSTPATATAAHRPMACPQEVEAVCAFIRQHYAEHLTLEHLCRCAGLSKSTLLRAFVQAKGVTPYRYLEAVRIQKAQQFLFGNSALQPEKEGEQAHREPAFASVRHKKAAAHIILCSSFFILITFRSARMKGIVFCQQVNAVLVHADSLLPGMFCQCTMQATRHP